MDINFIEEVLEELDRTQARYFRIESQKKKIEIIRNPLSSFKELTKDRQTEPEKEIKKSKDEESLDETYDIKSPYIGFFQRSENKDSIAIVKLREIVESGKIMAYIRSMNIQYEVISDIKGKIVEVLVEDGQAVEYGQPLFRLKLVE
ncbi:MAG: biotin/lipoyl-binding protein [Spirochaetota bacterium]|nr:biotin/lipoyl-binding protein [Spirochaetota bacterium]